MVKTSHIIAAVLIITAVIIASTGYLASRPSTVREIRIVVTAEPTEQEVVATATESGPRVVVVTATYTPLPQPSATMTATPTPTATATRTPIPVFTKVKAPQGAVSVASPVPAVAVSPDKLPHFSSISWDAWLNEAGNDHGDFLSYSASGAVDSAMLNGQPVTEFVVWLNRVRQFNHGTGAFTTQEQSTYWQDVQVCVTTLDFSAGDCRNFKLPKNVNGGGGDIAPTPPTPHSSPTRVQPHATHTPVPACPPDC